MDEFFIKWLIWVASGTIFIHRSFFRDILSESEQYNKYTGLCELDVPFPVLAKGKQDQRIIIYTFYFPSFVEELLSVDLYTWGTRRKLYK